MSGIACAVDNCETVQLVTGHDPEDSWDEYERDPLFAETVNAIAHLRADSVSFVLGAPEHVYEVPRELVGLVE